MCHLSKKTESLIHSLPNAGVHESIMWKTTGIGHINITLKFHKTMKVDNRKQNHILLNHKVDTSGKCSKETRELKETNKIASYYPSK